MKHWTKKLFYLLANQVSCGEFTGASGRTLKGYLDCRPVLYNSEGLGIAVHALVESDLEQQEFDAVAGPGFGAAALVSGLLAHWCRHGYVEMGAGVRGAVIRPEAKLHGSGGRLVGRLNQGDKVLLVDDVATSGGSLVDAVRILRAHGCQVAHAVVLVDREQGAVESLRELGVTLDTLFTFDQLAASTGQQSGVHP